MKLTDYTEEEKRARHKQQQKEWRDNHRERNKFLIKRWHEKNKDRRLLYTANYKQKLQDFKQKAALYYTCILDCAIASPVRL